MFVIRKKQMEAFQPEVDKTFINSIVEFLKENHPAQVVHLPETEIEISKIPEEKLYSMAREGFYRARDYGITWKSTLKSFVVLMFLTSPNFDEYEKAKKTLGDQELEINESVDKIIEEFSEEDWNEIENAYNPTKWQLTYEG